jgi:hypothetical protein
MDIVIVVWDDAESREEWMPIHEVRRFGHTPTVIQDIGVLLGKTENEVVICSALSADKLDGTKEYAYVRRIPMGMVKDLKYVAQIQ